MHRGSSLVLPVTFLIAAHAVAVPIQRTIDPAMSPDGRSIAFSWQGDLWTVSVAGGQAKRLTVHPGDDTMPKWTPDGSRIFFSSNRAGSLDVYSVTPDGNDLRRVTFESATEYPQSFSPDGTYLYGYTTAFGRSDLFKVKATGGDIVRLTGHPLELEYYPAVSPDGKWVVFNARGSAANWRKPGLKGSNTSKVWIAENTVPLKSMKIVYPGDRSDMFPVFLGADRIAFVSNRSGVPNIWTGSLTGGSPSQVTKFSDGTVRSLSASSDGNVVAFQKDSRIWVCNPKSGEAAPLDIDAPADSPRDPVQDLSLTTGANGITVSPNGKRAVLTLRGDLFLLPEKGGTTRRLTESPRMDGQPQWLDDKTLVYVAAGEASKRSLKTITIEGESKDLLTDTLDLNAPILSPDRKWIAYHRGDRELYVMPAAGGASRKVVEGTFSEAIRGGRAFNWSPDSQWLVYRTTLKRGIEIAMVKADGSQRVSVAKIGKDSSTPVFSADGKAIVFSATEGVNYSEIRDGKTPVYVVDLVPQPATYTEDDLDKIDAPKEEVSKDVTVKVVERGLEKRRRVLATGDAGGIWPAADGKSVYANIDGQFSSVNLKTGTVTPVAGVTGPAGGLELSSNKQKLYFIQAGKPSAMTLPTGALTPIAFNAQFKVDLAEEESALFDEVWWAMGSMYYNPAMNGKDWAGIRKKFGQIVPFCQSRDDFYALMGEMMELLDSSHLGATSPVGFRATTPEETAWLGVEWDWRALDARGSYVVAKVYEDTPAANPDSELRVGDKLVAVDGQKIAADKPLAMLLNRRAGRKVKLSLVRDDKPVDITIQPARAASKTGVFYDDWVDSNKKMVDKLSNGRLGYIHIEGMDVPSLDVFLREIQTELNGKDGVLLDVRFNGGGFTSHIILNTMLKFPWLIRTNRDDPDNKFSENSYRGNALELPAACLTNEYSFSNAEIFSEGFRYMKLGPVIGERTAGGVIGTSSYSLWDGGTIRMPSSGAYAVNGENLEQNGRLPDIDVQWDPNAWMDGRDPQLEVAVKELLKRIKK